jgi:hypothetical protein
MKFVSQSGIHYDITSYFFCMVGWSTEHADINISLAITGKFSVSKDLIFQKTSCSNQRT